MSHLPYKEKLEFLGLDALVYRRLMCDLVIMYKMVHNLIDVDGNSLKTINSLYLLLKTRFLNCINR